MLKKKLGPEAVERDWSWYIKSLKDYFKIPSTLIIPEGCRWIGGYTFEYCWWLKKVEIPGSVKNIGGCAFRCCEKLGKVVIPESVERIGYCAFYYCSNATIILRKPRSEYKFIGRYRVFDDVKDVKEEIRN